MSRGSAEGWLTGLVRYRAIDLMRKIVREAPGLDLPEEADESPGPLDTLLNGWDKTPGRGDFISNILLYMPLGFIGTITVGRRVGLAQALLHDPPVLVLDEPTDGLDPNQKHEVRLLIQQMAPEKAIVISTHILEEVDAVCSRAIIIARGRIVADATPQALQGRHPSGKLDDVFRNLTLTEAA